MTPLSYCTNVHPAEDLDGILDQLGRLAGPVRDQLGWDRLGVGLWLADDVAAQLARDASAVARLRRELDARGLAVVTLNAFPYRGFHDAVVKGRVYQPRWTDPERLRYTVDCARVLTDLLPDDEPHGSISTLPLGWRDPWTSADDDAATAALDQLTAGLRALPRPVRIAVEPEPGCILDTVDDAVGWLAGRVDPEVIGICLDTCHLAVSFADPAGALRRISDAGLSVVKVQASAALHVDDPSSPAGRAVLERFAEPRYLHQVREAGDPVLAADDLPADDLPRRAPWRVHFHVPLHWAPDADAASRPTTEVLEQVLAGLDPAALPHVEVETYTWGVLPEGERPTDDAALVRGIAAELAWAGEALPARRPDQP